MSTKGSTSPAGLLVTLLLAVCVAVYPLTAYADQAVVLDAPAETGESATSESVEAASQKDATPSDEDPTVDEAVESEEEPAAETDVVSDADASVDVLDYVYIDSDVVSVDGTQYIMIALADEGAAVQQGTLVLERIDTQETLEIATSAVADNVMLFSPSFDTAAGYRLVSVRYTLAGPSVEQEVDLTATDDSSLQFDVVEPDLAEALSDTDGDGIAAFTLDDQGNPVSASSVDEAIAQADSDGVQESVDEATPLSATPSKARSAVTSTREDYLIVAIDPGHGGYDPGAVANGMRESDLTLSIATHMRDELNTYTGVTPYMTRSNDSYVGLQQRVDLAANVGADVFVSIHINAGGGAGIEVYVPHDGNYLYQETHVAGTQLAEKVVRHLTALGLGIHGQSIRWDSLEPDADYPAYPDGTWADYLAVIRGARRAGFPGILIEHGFIDNSADAAKLASDSMRAQMGAADATSVAEQYNLGKESAAQSVASVKVTAHVADLGWEDAVYDQKVAGTTGKGKSLQAFQVQLQNAPVSVGGSIEYRSYVDNAWQGWVSNGSTSGTTGQNKAVQAVQIQLKGNVANQYDVYYRVHSAEVGWLGWAKNGESAGTRGYGYDAQALEVVVVAKGAAAPGSTADAYRDKANAEPVITYRAHVQDIGWQSDVNEGNTAGTTGQSKHVEALTVTLDPGKESGGLSVEAHVQDYGWREAVGGGQTAGTTGKSKQMEAVRIKLTGSIADNYDIYYRVHAANVGWMAWAKNGESAGTQGYGYAIEAVQIVLQKKGEEAPATSPANATSDAFRQKPVAVSYRARVANIGWQSYVENGSTAGTTGRGLSVEALNVTLTNQVLGGGIQTRVFVADSGWLGWTTGQAGTTGHSKQVEAVRIRLTGEMAEQYDVYYRVHSAEVGWLGWAKNGASAGTEGYSYGVQALQVKLVKKNGKAPGSTSNTFKAPQLAYRAHSAEIGWQSFVGDGATAGTTGRGLAVQALEAYFPGGEGTVKVEAHIQDLGWVDSVTTSLTRYAGTVGQGKRMEAVRITLGGDAAEEYDVYYRVHAANIGWMDWAKNGERAGTQGYGYGIEAIQIRLVEKGGDAPGSTEVAFRTPTDIMGASMASVRQMVSYYNDMEGAYPSAVYDDKGADSIADYCLQVDAAARSEGVRSDVLFCQAMKETGWLQFGGSVKVEQCNFGGLGATSSIDPGYTFKDVGTGLLAQTQHLKAYASTKPLNEECVDPRFSLVARGSATRLEELDGKWAVPGNGYGEDIAGMINELLTY